MIGKNVKVTLTAFETELAVNVGVRRQLAALRDGRPDKHGYAGDGWSIHIHGAGGEMAFAKAAGLYWNGSVDTFSDPDVGTFQVRTRSGIGERNSLIVRPGDEDSSAFVLVIGQIPEYTIVGWLYGHSAKDAKWIQTYGNRPGAYFVPQDELNPFPLPAISKAA